jgi:ABC-type glutathione transport system ATPase component
MNSRVQDGLDKQRKHLEDQIRRMQVAAHRDTTGKSNGQIASKKKKLARHGYEKNVNGHRFRAQHEATAKRASMRAGSQNGLSLLSLLSLLLVAHSRCPLETSLGGKTGQSRCLIEAAEREWEMELPVPTPLSSLAPILQLRNISAGFLNQPSPSPSPEGQETTSEDKDLASAVTPTPTPPVAVTSTATSTTAKKLKVLGSGKQLKKVTTAEDTQREFAAADVKKILDSVTLDLDQNTKIAILGKNGCGKRSATAPLCRLLTAHYS